MHSWFESSDRASMFKIRRQQSAASLTSVSTDFLDTLSIKEVRSNLLKDYEHSKELYSEKDLEKIVNSNDYIRRYLKVSDSSDFLAPLKCSSLPDRIYGGVGNSYFNFFIFYITYSTRYV